MAKGKPRYNPDKPANKRGGYCSHCEGLDGTGDGLSCNYDGKWGAAICKGNPHNCIKVSLHKLAGLREVQRDNGVIPAGVSVNRDGNLYNPM